MSRSSRMKVSDMPEYELKWNDEVLWSYEHFTNSTTSFMRTKRGRFVGKVLHMRSIKRRSDFVQLAFVHFNGNKKVSRVPAKDLKKV